MLEIRVFLTIIGLLIGSFLNVIIYRLPRLMSITWVRSHCTDCGKKIYWYENLPVLSYLFLRGKCSGCHSKIAFKYPLVEIISALAAFFLSGQVHEVQDLWLYGFYFSVFSLLLCQFFIDLEHRLLLDSLNLILGLLFFIFGSLYFLPWKVLLLGGLLGYSIPFLINLLFYLLRGIHGLGGGDVKLFGALGLFLGPLGIVHNMVLSCTLGAIVGVGLIIFKKMSKEQPIPFGPFIIIIACWQIYFPSSFEEMVKLIFG